MTPAERQHRLNGLLADLDADAAELDLLVRDVVAARVFPGSELERELEWAQRRLAEVVYQIRKAAQH